MTPPTADQHGGENYDMGRGPAGRGMRTPHDLYRSRRVGLVRESCPECGAIHDQGFTRHEGSCSYAVETCRPDWKRERTGALPGHGHVRTITVHTGDVNTPGLLFVDDITADEIGWS